MKKIPTLFVRKFEGHKIVDITDEITPGCEDAFLNGIATVKWDGSCCAIIDGVFYKRYDCKKGKTPPEGAIPCCDPDPVTGHWPHWVMVEPNDSADKWFVEAYDNSVQMTGNALPDATYEAIGPHFQGNPSKVDSDRLIEHGICGINVERNFESVKEYLRDADIEGIVFWLNDEPVCKIKKTDFGFAWRNFDNYERKKKGKK